MKSKTSFFNIGIYKSMLRRFWPLWVLHFCGFLLVPITTLANSIGPYVDDSFVHTISGSMAMASPVIALIMAVISAMAVYGFMYNSRSTGLIASLPVCREAVFASSWFAAVSAIVVSNIAIALLTFLFALPSGAAAAPAFNSVCQWLAIYSMHFILFFGIASLTAVMTGNSAAMPVLFIIFNFLAVGIELLMRLYCSALLWGMEQMSYSPVLDFLSPVVYFLANESVEMTYVMPQALNVPESYMYGIGTVVGFTYKRWLASIIYCGVGLIFSVIALIMYRSRRMETAGNVISVAKLKPVFKYGVSICVALCGGLLIYLLFYNIFDSSNAATLVSMIVGMIAFAFIGYFGAKMLLEKSFHVFRGSWVGYIVTCCLCITFVFCCDLDVLNICSRVPDPDDVASISVYDAGSISDSRVIEQFTELHEKIISERSHYENYTPGENEYFSPISFVYYLKDGHTIKRTYDIIADDENYLAYYDIMNATEVLRERFSSKFPVDTEHCYEAYLYCPFMDDAISLTSRQAVDFYNNGLMPDIEAGNKLLFSGTGIPCYASVSLCLADSIDPEQTYEYDDIQIDISPTCENCIAWVKDNLGLDLKQQYIDYYGEDGMLLD